MKSLDKYFKLADNHKCYCDANCNKDIFITHTIECRKQADLHCNSYIECFSTYCLNYLKQLKLIPSYKRNKEKKEVLISVYPLFNSDSE